MSWDQPIVLMYYPLLMLCAFVLYRVTGHLRSVNVVSIVFVLAMVQYGVSGPLFATGVLEAETRPANNLLEVILLTIGCFVVGVTLESLGDRQRSFHSGQRVEQRAFYFERISPIFLLLMLVVGAALFLLHIRATGKVGLNVLIDNAGDYLTIRDHRLYGVRNSPFYYWTAVYGNIALPIITLIPLFGFMHSRRSWLLLMFLVSFVFGVVLRIDSVNKFPVVAYLSTVMYGYYLFRQIRRRATTGGAPRRIPLGIVVIIAVAFAGFVVLGIGQYGEYDAISRIFVVPVACLNQFLTYYPSYFDFQWGRGIGLVASVLGDSGYVAPHTLLYEQLRAHWGTSNAIWSADMWANFGYWGVILGSILTGFLLGLIERKFRRLKMTTFVLAVYCQVLLAATHVVNCSLFTAALSIGLVTGPLFGIGMRKIQEMLDLVATGRKGQLVAVEEPPPAGARPGAGTRSAEESAR